MSALNNTEALERADKIIQHLLFDNPIHDIANDIKAHDRFMDNMRSLTAGGPRLWTEQEAEAHREKLRMGPGSSIFNRDDEGGGP